MTCIEKGRGICVYKTMHAMDVHGQIRNERPKCRARRRKIGRLGNDWPTSTPARKYTDEET